MSLTQVRAARHQQPQMTAPCLVLTPSALDRPCVCSLPEDGSLHLPWPEHHRGPGANTNVQHNGSDKNSMKYSSRYHLLRAHCGSGLLVTAESSPSSSLQQP